MFSEAEAQSVTNPLPVVVSESLMRSLGTNFDDFGTRIRVPNSGDAQIVGVVADTSSVRVGEADGPVLYQPISAAGRWSRAPHITRLSVLLAVTRDPRPIAEALRAEINALDPQIVITPEPVSETITREAERYVTVVALTGILAGMAVVLSLIGIYGVTADLVAQRRKDIGIRIALGARAHEIVRLFVWSLRRPVVIGFSAGGILAVLGGWWMQYARLLPVNAAGHAAWIYVAALVFLVGTAVVATASPALRAAMANPWDVLRND